jgi:hypothetical protein
MSVLINLVCELRRPLGERRQRNIAEFESCRDIGAMPHDTCREVTLSRALQLELGDRKPNTLSSLASHAPPELVAQHLNVDEATVGSLLRASRELSPCNPSGAPSGISWSEDCRTQGS